MTLKPCCSCTILRHFRCFVCFVVNSEVITYNAALNKTAYQSSVFKWGGKLLSANLANDGSRETIALRGRVPRCSASQRDINPWWAVDLGRPTAVYAVNFTNRGDCCGMKNTSFLRIYLFLFKYIVDQTVFVTYKKNSTGFVVKPQL